MANIKSQKKRILTNAKSKEINTARRTRVRNLTKEYRALIDTKDLAGAEAKLPELVSELMSSDIMHKKSSSRKIAYASRLLDELKKQG